MTKPPKANVIAPTTSEELEERVAERTAQLRRLLRDHEELLARERSLRADVETANAARDRLLAILSHDLRGPLNAVLGWTALLRREPLDRRTLDKALATIEHNANTQVELLDAHLDVSWISAGRVQLDMRVVDLAELVRTAVDAALPAVREKGIDLAAPTRSAEALVVGDSARLRQVVTSLLANTVEHTPAEGRIDIALATAEAVELRVRNAGAAMPAGPVPFELDLRQSEQTSPARLKGLALYVARRLVEMHGGRVRANTERESRARELVVSLPRRNPSSTCVEQDDRRGTLRSVRILLVDDDVDTRELLGACLMREGAVPVTAADGRTALETCRDVAPDVVVTAVALPDMDGGGLVQRMRAGPSGADLCAIAISDFASSDDAARDPRFDAHLAKPLRMRELVDAIATARRRRIEG